jgi:uncharacterized membrane protein YqgA involved in biofilm formation
VIGTYLNAAGIVAGGLVGLAKKKPLSAGNQLFFKTALGGLAVFFGLRLTWVSINGSVRQILIQLGVMIL